MGNYFRAYRSGSYGPPNVTDKYKPLRNVNFTESDEKYCNGLLSRRWRVLNSVGLLPKPLALVLPNWDDAIAAEDGKKPPLVVISTNRSNWIKKGFNAAKMQLTTYDIEEFDNASDLRALTAVAGQTVSPPMYLPSRIGEDAGPRNVYVVVHAEEYTNYKNNLAGTGMTVVGWAFQSPRPGEIPVCGFGASRFAAIEFCKELRRAAGDPWDYAWLFDDNVVAFTSFAGYGKVEAAMDAGKANPKPLICAGFSGGSCTDPQSKNKKWANDEILAGEKEENERGKQYSNLPKVASKGLVQQASLWNIAELKNRNLNFGPIFVASAEDVSLGKYFDLKKIPYLFYEGINVIKEDPGSDGGPSSKTVQSGREKLMELIAESERIDARPYLDFPPPIKFKPLIETGDKVCDDTEQTLGHFVVNCVLPHASAAIKLVAGDKNKQNIAMCQATEQSICDAIERGLVDDPALNQTFKINGDLPQDVRQVSRP